ncbi:MAG: hypothetical protein KAR79_05395, partial [Simkaniaceae bacterium]|nr:hypothetical protein [Simkaniaceae bacterium]
MTQKKKFSLVKSIAVIALSTILFSAIFYAALGRIHQIKKKRLESDKFSIKSLIHTSYQKYALASIYLEELMNLSCDRPTNIFCFDKEVATKKLLESPVIKQVNICLENPDTIKVDYEIRKPLAWCYDFENIVIDEEGYLLPLYPFFSPKILTEMYFGLETFEGFDEPIKGKHVDLAMQLFHMLHSEGDATTFFIKRVDVSNAFSPSYGKREVVVVLEHEAFSP